MINQRLLSYQIYIFYDLEIFTSLTSTSHSVHIMPGCFGNKRKMSNKQNDEDKNVSDGTLRMAGSLLGNYSVVFV